jgi:hypothetical protein
MIQLTINYIRRKKMPKIAEIIDDTIVGVVMAETVEDAQQLHNRECLDLSIYEEGSIPGIGWVRTNGVFAFPEPEIED